jgi:hypothetical protein
MLERQRRRAAKDGPGAEQRSAAIPGLCLPVGRQQREDAMSSKKLDAAIDALVDALAELPEHELEG